MPTNQEAAKLGRNLHEINARLINTLSADKGLLDRTSGRVNQLIGQLKETNAQIDDKTKIHESCGTPSTGWFSTGLNVLAKTAQVAGWGGKAILQFGVDIAKDWAIDKYVMQYTSMPYLTKSPNFSTMVDDLVTTKAGRDGVIGKVLDATTIDQKAVQTVQDNINPSLKPERFHQLIGAALTVTADGAKALVELREIAKLTGTGGMNIGKDIEELNHEMAQLKVQENDLKNARQELLQLRESLGIKTDSKVPEYKNVSVKDMKAKLEKTGVECAKIQKELEEMETKALKGKAFESLSPAERAAISNKFENNPKVAKLWSKLSNLTSDMSVLAEQIAIQEKKEAKSNTQIKTAPKDLKGIEKELNKIDRQLEITGNKSKQLENMRDYLTGKNSAMPRELDQNEKILKEDIGKLESQHHELSTKADKLNSEIKSKSVGGKDVQSLVGKLDSMDKERKALKAQKKNLEQSYDDLKTEKKQIGKTDKYAKDQKKTSESENKSRAASIKTKLSENKQQQAELKRKMSELDKKIDGNKELLKKAESRSTDSSAKSQQKRQEETSKLQSEFDEVQSKLKATNKELDSKRNLLSYNDKMVAKVKKNEAMMTPVVEALTGRPNVTKQQYSKEKSERIQKNLTALISNPTLSTNEQNILKKAILQLPVTIGASIFGDKYLSWGQLQAGAFLGSKDAVQAWLDVPSNEGGLVNAAMELIFLELTDKVLQEMVDSAKLAKRSSASGLSPEQKMAQDQMNTNEAQVKLNEAFDETVDALDKLKKNDSLKGIGASLLLQNVLKGTDVSGKIIEPLRQTFQNWLNPPLPFPVAFHGTLRDNSDKKLTESDAGIGKAMWVKDHKTGHSVILVRLPNTKDGKTNTKTLDLNGDNFEAALARANSELNGTGVTLTKESFV